MTPKDRSKSLLGLIPRGMKLIGKCKECKYYKLTKSGVPEWTSDWHSCNHRKAKHIICDADHDTFGCIYWKRRK